jgi:hypothetical protein
MAVPLPATLLNAAQIDAAVCVVNPFATLGRRLAVDCIGIVVDGG